MSKCSNCGFDFSIGRKGNTRPPRISASLQREGENKTRNAALEEAAKVADNCDTPSFFRGRAMARQIAAAIREMKR